MWCHQNELPNIKNGSTNVGETVRGSAIQVSQRQQLINKLVLDVLASAIDNILSYIVPGLATFCHA